ncbi:MAG: flagellar protein [Cellulosilyticaceae bacterium]
MEVKSCRRCNRLFQYVAGPVICPECKDEEEKIFVVVRDFIRDNKGVTMEEVCRETGVAISVIEKFLKQGRLEIAEDSPIKLACERCGVRIRSGRYCNTCKENIAKELGSMAEEIKSGTKGKEEVKARMRFLNKNK